MASRLDIIIYGASGFTGKHTVLELGKLATAEGYSITWGVAGRSESKLKDVLEEIGKRNGTDYSKIPIIIADTNDEESLQKMTAQARIIVNTVGPYRFYGEPVVKACVATSTNYVDVSGEPQFIEAMQLKYNEAAAEKGIYIISTCGFDSIPCDMGIVYLQQNFNGVLNSVETYLEGKEEGEPTPGASINYGTWESAVHGLANWNELREIRSKLYPQRLPSFKPKLPKRFFIHKSEVLNKWSFLFLGSDRSVALRSQRFFYEHDKQRPAQVQTYACLDSLFSLLVLAFFGAIFVLFTKLEFTRNLLLKHPKLFSGGFFSREGPSEAKQKKTKFQITFVGQGWSEKLSDADDEYSTPPNKTVKVKVSGTNPGYGTTCVAVVLSAMTILKESSKMPNNGGVLPPGAAFAKTSLIENLNKHGLQFEIL